ncbi:MAG: IreB family regulatory phosphoprotein [Syntrophomonadaceae bacterium]
MPQDPRSTVNFKLSKDEDNKVHTILHTVYAALEAKGYNPINQLVGYMISGDPAYITSHNDARTLICKIDRDEILELLLKSFLQK